MLKRKLLTAGLIMAATSSASAASYGFFDAKSVAMGNVSVATGNTTTAALSNPAMLMVNESDDTFALLIPALGIQLVDNGGMIDLVDEFQDLPQNAANANRLIDISTELNGTSVVGNVAANVALAYSGDDYSWAASYRGTGQAGIIYNQTVPGVINTSAPDGELEATGIFIQEIGVSLATSFDIAGMKLSVGIKPKTVQVDLITNTENISTFDEDDFIDDAIETDLGSFSSLDAGIALQLSDSFTIGLAARNLIEESITNASFAGGQLNFDKHLRAGVSYHNDFLTIAADVDLTEIDPISFEDPSKMAALGIEFDLGDIVQLRAGYQTNTANGATEPDLFSAGVGLWLGFHLDIAAVVGEDSSLGAFVQTGFRF